MIVFGPAFHGALAGWRLIPVLFSPAAWVLMILFVFSLWVPLLMADLLERRAKA